MRSEYLKNVFLYLNMNKEIEIKLKNKTKNIMFSSLSKKIN